MSEQIVTQINSVGSGPRRHSMQITFSGFGQVEGALASLNANMKLKEYLLSLLQTMSKNTIPITWRMFDIYLGSNITEKTEYGIAFDIGTQEAKASTRGELFRFTWSYVQLAMREFKIKNATMEDGYDTHHLELVIPDHDR